MKTKNKGIKISFFLPSLNIGGVESVFITYANELYNRGYIIEFVLCKKVGELLPLVSHHIPLVSLGNTQLRYAFLKLRKYIKSSKPDVMISGGDFPNLMLILSALYLRQRPIVIISKHNYQNVETKNLGWWAKMDILLQKKLYPKADRIIAVSKGIEKYLIDDLNIAPQKIAQICNPIDIDDIIKKGYESLGLVLPDEYVVFVGRLGKVKNLLLLLKAFDWIYDEKIHLVIVGDGSERETLERFAFGLSSKKNIHFVGSISNPMPIIRKAKVLVLCSFSEAYPTILLEAMAFNVPIVATPTEGAKEILKDVKGAYLANSFDDVNEISNLIELAIHNDTIFMKEYVSKNEKKNIVNIMENEINKSLNYERRI